MTSPTSTPDTQASIPITRESMAGALIDSARISVMAAMTMLPPAPESLIIQPGDRERPTEEWTTEECLEQAMSWLDSARIQTIEAGAPVTSLHIAGGRDRSGIGPDDEVRRP